MHVVYVIVYFKIQISVGLYVKRIDLNVLNHVFVMGGDSKRLKTICLDLAKLEDGWVHCDSVVEELHCLFRVETNLWIIHKP